MHLYRVTRWIKDQTGIAHLRAPPRLVQMTAYNAKRPVSLQLRKLMGVCASRRQGAIGGQTVRGIARGLQNTG